jgi:O-methyltransferase
MAHPTSRRDVRKTLLRLGIPNAFRAARQRVVPHWRRLHERAEAWWLGGTVPFEDLTMVPRSVLLRLARQVDAVLRQGVPGDLVECGVWRGGAALLMADRLRRMGDSSRRVWLIDSFEGLPSPEEVDGPTALEWTRNTSSVHYHDNCRASMREVEEAAAALGLRDRIEIVAGWFEETLPTVRAAIGPIALLRIDADWHASVRCCLEHLYDSVSPGGLVLIDDYDFWDGCAIAVHEFLGSRQLSHRIRHDGIAYFRKDAV